MCMNASAHVKLPAPSFSVRIHNQTPDEFLLRACELARLGMGVPAFYNVSIKTGLNSTATFGMTKNSNIVVITPVSNTAAASANDNSNFKITAKGTYMKSVYLSSTMGPAIRVNPLKF